ncbi:uncharacterized protein SPAPADRAFT_51792 [Spathaspora passalidarum NRRL Y-27907]|uniref:Inner kinetochore subunit AME1 domain-containing protein n=1 Tax=Spathaspora passalidarum (strain NRRL Y-27907 / 11-Y1) TaxID=619300 RepID=G3ARX0_SPAPN|nr:uncharacterized protein SPAPADRAFT_51792 [Spathaspora passalidarum NRRL Y-27907]EGW31819.1 hypothetical protein SPAPADRAFT_51792 [Spathaspora passalidarum NRRL Y-27907]
MEDRTLRREARVRGSGQRSIRSSVTLKINSPKGGRMLQQLQSAFVKPDDLNLPRTRRRSTLSNNTSLDLAEARIEIDHNRLDPSIEEHEEELEDEQEDDDYKVEDEDDEEEEEEAVSMRHFKPATGTKSSSLLKTLPIGGLLSKLSRSQERVTNDIEQARKKVNSRQKQFNVDKVKDDSRKKTRDAGSKRTRKRVEEEEHSAPKKRKQIISGRQATVQTRNLRRRSKSNNEYEEEPLIETSSQSLVPIGTMTSRSVRSQRTINPVSSNSETSESEDDTHDRNYSDTDASSPPAPTPTGKPVPLSQTKHSRTQKPLTVDFQRLEDSKRRLAPNKRFRVHTIDVLRHLFKLHEPRPTSEALDEDMLHSGFKRVAMLHLDKMRDLYAVVDDLSLEIANVQRKKNQYRQMILDLKKEHTNVGNEMNRLRIGARKTIEEAEEVNLIHSQLSTLKQAETDPGDSISCDSEVNLTLNRLSRVVNPEMGILPKLKCVSNKLTKMNEKL